jgi:hypothetical protein
MIVHTITHEQSWYAALDDPTEGLNAVTLHQLVTHICTTYAQISQPDLDNNVTDFNLGIHPNLPLAVYMHKQEKCWTFAQDAGVPISKEIMAMTGTKHTLNCMARMEALSPP